MAGCLDDDDDDDTLSYGVGHGGGLYAEERLKRPYWAG